MSNVRQRLVMNVCNMEDCEAKESRPRKCILFEADSGIGIVYKMHVCLACLNRLVTEHLTFEEMPIKRVEDI